MKVLVIGYGSIGAQHARILASMEMVNTVCILSSQSNLPFITINKIEDIISLDPDYIVIASATSKHYEQLLFIEQNCRNKLILVEKPLFSINKEFEVQNNTVFIGYLLRFNPAIQFIKKKCFDKKLWSINAICGSYLPEWRRGIDYRITSSAIKAMGGGVLLDLSHELDYIQWIVGDIEPEHVISRKISDLEIDTDDQLLLTSSASNDTFIQLNMNYFSRIPMRQIIIDGEKISIIADIIKNEVRISENGKHKVLSWEKTNKDELIRIQHESVLKSDDNYLCTFFEGSMVMKLIEKIQKWN